MIRDNTMMPVKPNLFKRLRFLLRTGHRDPSAWIDSLARKQPKDGEVLTEQRIREALKGMPKDLRL